MAGALDLLNLLSGESGITESLGALSDKSSVSQDQLTSVLLSALPSMLGKMQTNAGTKDGADSLLKALDQHDITSEDLVKIIKTSDMADGVKIINHIYGDEKKAAAAQAEVAKKTGLDAAQVAKIMAAAAPAVLTFLAASNKKTNNTKQVSNSDGLADMIGSILTLTGGSSKGGLDLGSLIGAATGSSKNSGVDIGSILGSLLK